MCFLKIYTCTKQNVLKTLLSCHQTVQIIWGVGPMFLWCWANVIGGTPPLNQHCIDIACMECIVQQLPSAGEWNHFAMNTNIIKFIPLTAKLFNLNFHPLKVVSRWRNPQLQVSENYSDLTKWRSIVFKSCWLMSHFIFNMFKRWYLMC